MDVVPLVTKELEEACINLEGIGLEVASFAVAVDKDSSFVSQEEASLANLKEASLVGHQEVHLLEDQGLAHLYY